jgi:hypothetical protein
MNEINELKNVREREREREREWEDEGRLEREAPNRCFSL